MCGRLLLTTSVEEIGNLFGCVERPLLLRRWNVAPMQPVPAVRRDENGRHLVALRWGLVPGWADDPGIGARMINARSESVAEKPAFRDAFAKRRCLVPADGFYEWAAVGKRKQGYAIRRRDRETMALAGLWERWTPKADAGRANEVAPLETLTILTTTANAVLRPLHDRMPVILDETAWESWLDPVAPRPALKALLRPAPDDRLEAYKVGPAVNNVRNDDPSCAAPLDETPTLF